MLSLINKKNSLFLFSILMVSLLNAQQLTLDLNDAPSTSNYPNIRVFDSDKLGQKKIIGIDYADAEGTPFWQEKWISAYIYIKNGGLVKVEKAKLNLYTGDVHYINESGIELAADISIVEKVIFLQNLDTNKIIAHFISLYDYVNKKPAALYKQFNTKDKYQLLLLQKKFVNLSAFDPLQGKKIATFFNRNNYSIYHNGINTPLKGLDRSSVLDAVPKNEKIDNWLVEKKNKLKNETDIIALLNFINTL